MTPAGSTWLRLMNAIDDDNWPEQGGKVRIPELRTTSADVREPLRLAHELALWVATLDPYASRDSLHAALGEDVAILHQERRLGGDSPLSLVLSQRSGGPADRAIGRSLKAAGIVADRDVALEIGGELRKVASQGYGILALEAATTGAGINELVGHVVAFSLLSRRATPWPLPPGCRVLLVSLDDYKQWFPVQARRPARAGARHGRERRPRRRDRGQGAPQRRPARRDRRDRPAAADAQRDTVGGVPRARHDPHPPLAQPHRRGRLRRGPRVQLPLDRRRARGARAVPSRERNPGVGRHRTHLRTRARGAPSRSPAGDRRRSGADRRAHRAPHRGAPSHRDRHAADRAAHRGGRARAAARRPRAPPARAR